MEFPLANNDDERGQTLLDATMNYAVAGDTVVAGPGNYKKKGPITKDGVKIHLFPGARIYSSSATDGPVIFVGSGTHWLSGHGIIEHTQVVGASDVQAVSVIGGTLLCEADEIICADQAAVHLAGSSATLYANVRKVLARDGNGFNLADGTCFIRAQHVVADSNLTQGSGVSVFSGNSSSVRILNVQRIDSTKGPSILLQGSGRCNMVTERPLHQQLCYSDHKRPALSVPWPRHECRIAAGDQA
jgi:hypothetical protein